MTATETDSQPPETPEPVGADGDSNANDDVEGDSKRAPLTIAEAFELVRSSPQSLLFKVLKDPKFAYARDRVFAGFRINTETLRSSLARGRLATELLNDEKLTDAVREAVCESAASPRSQPSPSPPAPQAPSSQPTPPKEDRIAQISTDRDRLKREAQSAQQQAKKALEDRRESEREAKSLRTELAEARAQLSVEHRQGAWRDRRLRRLERELMDARAAAPVAPRVGEAPPLSRVSGESIGDQGPKQSKSVSQTIVVEAMERLLSRRKTEAVALVVEEILQQDASNIVARRIRALVRIAEGRRADALEDLRFVFEAYRVAGDLRGAAWTVVQTASALGEPDRKMAQSLFAAVSKRPDLAPQVAEALAALVGTPHYDTLRSWCLGALKMRLFAESGLDSGAMSLPRELVHSLGNVSPQRLVQAVDRNEERMVTAARQTVRQLDKASRDLLESSLAAIAEPSYFHILARRELAGPAIIDASNVGNYELELMASERPLLGSVLAVRNALRARGHFPIIAIADANLPYTIDRVDALRSLIERGEIEVVAGGTDADEVIVSEARRLGAVVITNDYMADWDPTGEIDKAQYTISLTDGRATLYF